MQKADNLQGGLIGAVDNQVRTIRMNPDRGRKHCVFPGHLGEVGKQFENGVEAFQVRDRLINAPTINGIGPNLVSILSRATEEFDVK